VSVTLGPGLQVEAHEPGAGSSRPLPAPIPVDGPVLPHPAWLTGDEQRVAIRVPYCRETPRHVTRSRRSWVCNLM
jgi:hypothetical protein